MPTKLIYLEDSYKRELDANVVSVSLTKNKTRIVLDRTIFYPVGGGQPSDQGQITSKNTTFKVESVFLQGKDVVHEGKFKNGKFKQGDNVKCTIDWDRRHKYMQIHSAGHLLHEAVKSLYPSLVPIEGKHASSAYLKYEGELDKSSADKILRACNSLRSKGLDIKTEFVTLEELKKKTSWLPAKLPTNKPLRIVQIGKFEPIPDGGTQLNSTLEIPSFSSIVLKAEGKHVFVYYKLEPTKVGQKKEQSGKEDTLNASLPLNLDSEAILSIQNSALAQIMEANSPHELEELRIRYLSRKGVISELIKSLKKLPQKDKKVFGSLLNGVKDTLTHEIGGRKNSFKVTKRKWFDPTYPVGDLRVGRLHPTTQVIAEMSRIFAHMGFSAMEGPEIETDEYNFEKLNLPKDHPARSLQDVLYIAEPDILLRSHTSSVETRTLEKYSPPFRVYVAGKCYRYETVNASNNAMFYQFQGVALQKVLSMADLKGVLYNFAHEFFGSTRKIRYRCKYYPEVEPGVGMDLDCTFCKQKGCGVCKGRGWIEMLGAGMIHPNILKKFNYDPKEISGFAFGMGLDRIVMDRFQIPDIRSLYNGDINYS